MGGPHNEDSVMSKALNFVAKLDKRVISNGRRIHSLVRISGIKIFYFNIPFSFLYNMNCGDEKKWMALVQKFSPTLKSHLTLRPDELVMLKLMFPNRDFTTNADFSIRLDAIHCDFVNSLPIGSTQ